MINVDWAKLGSCPECGSISLDIESEDRIAVNYYLYCLHCRYQGETAVGEKGETLQQVADRAVENWINND